MDSKKLFGVGIGVLAVLVIAIVIAQPDLFLYLRITAGGDGDGGTQLSHTLTWTAAETDVGTHTIDIVAQDDQGGEATRTVTITVESGALQFSDFNFEVGDTTATMSWVTDKPTPGTGKADILDLDDLRLSEVDPSIGTSHSVTFTSLVPCTVYTANAEALLNDTLFTSDNQTFTTTGCTGGASIKATAKAELSSNGKEVKIDNAAKINFAQGQGNKSAVHLVQLDRDEALANIPSVDDKSAITGLYETTVVTGPQQKKGSLDGTATVTLEYTPAEDTDEETLSLYRYANGTWTELADRSIDTDAQTISGTTTEFSAVAGWASGGGSGDPEPSPSPSPSPPSDGGGDSGGGDSGGGGGGDSGGGGGGGGGDDSGGGEAAQPVRTYTIQAETGHQIKGAHAGVVKEGSTTAVKLAGNTDVLARKVTVPRDNYFLEVRVKDDAPGPVNYAVYVNDRAWKVSRADKGDNKYRTYRLGRLSNFASGTIRFRLINDTYDKANPGFEPTDRNLFVDYWRLTTAPGVSQGSTPTSTGGGAIATGGRSGGWTVLPRLNQIMREELGSQFIIPSNHSYYAARLTLPSNNRAVIQTEEHLRAVLRYWRGLRPNFPRGDDFDL